MAHFLIAVVAVYCILSVYLTFCNQRALEAVEPVLAAIDYSVDNHKPVWLTYAFGHFGYFVYQMAALA